MIKNKLPFGLYIHVPFCRSKCSYCDFYSATYNEDLAKLYVDAVISEFKSVLLEFDDIEFDTIYIGGGTPSVLSNKTLNKLIESILALGRFSDDLEFTLEVNPESAVNLKAYADAGVNRLSVGVQSLNNDILKSIGRIHTSTLALQVLEQASTYYKNVSADIMLGLPNQKLSDISTSISLIAPIVTHISAYILKLSDDSPLGLKVRDGITTIMSDDEMADQYECARDELMKFGFSCYEISNFAKSVNMQSRHNMKYWLRHEYIGLGPAAHSYINNKRFFNPPDLVKYLEFQTPRFPRTFYDAIPLTKQEEIFEAIMLGLRLTTGIDVGKLNTDFNIDFLTDYADVIKKVSAVTSYNNGHFAMLPGKMLLESAVAVEFLH
ncbi:MAG: radical SAM family heme chaperone HemW [Christensenellaceae bacterium]|jgi:oxygen-independent coproporphyrinogen-3 oxidase|nr:radical SAM family heme chaperone HemW [Christensenellaceae bacterium]